MYNQFWEKGDRIRILRGVKIVPPLIWLNIVHGKLQNNILLPQMGFQNIFEYIN